MDAWPEVWHAWPGTIHLSIERRVELVTLPALLFRDARVVDGIADEPFEAAVLVVDGHVAEIGALGMRAPDLPGLRVVALDGRTLMPGLIDAHVHPTATEVIVVNGDPLADVDVLARPQSTLRMVVTEGRVRLEHLA
jgi:imidazolonepropionase-like amidohydrolase